MPTTIRRPVSQPRVRPRVTPSIVDPKTVEPFTLDQELKPFGAWVGEPIWAPPQDGADALARTMLRETRPFTSKQKRWDAVERKRRGDFTQIREINLFEASIRLPQGKFFVTVTEEANFDKITDTIPACVQTRLDEFMNSPAKKQGAKVYYLKPLCVEVGDQLILTTREDLTAAIASVQDEVFARYRRLALLHRPLQAMTATVNLGLALPRRLVKHAVNRRQKAIDALQAHYEFERRKLALRTARNYNKCRTDGCTFDEVLEMTTPIQRTDAILQYCTEQELSKAKRDQLLQIAAGTIPWFVALSLTASYLSMVVLTLTAPPVVVCDPAFVAEIPGSNGVVLKIGHFDEVGGVTHVEI